MKKWLLLFLVLLQFACARYCAAEDNTLVVFSARKQPLIEPVISLFEQQTGVKVVLKAGKSGALAQQIMQELTAPSADVFIAKESGALEYLQSNGAFASYSSEATAKIPSYFKAQDGSWIGISGRSRAIIYNKDLIDESAVPKTLDALTDTKYAGKIAAVNSGNESLVAWVSALRIKLGDEKTKDILLKLKNNDIALLSDSHTDVRKAVGRGEYAMGLINHYYYHLQKNETNPSLRNVGIVYLDQQPGGRGEIVNVCGAGIIKNAANRRNAEQFIDFLVSPDAQKLFAEVNFEYPLLPAVETHPEVLESLNAPGTSALEAVRIMEIEIDRLGTELEKTRALLEEVQWR